MYPLVRSSTLTRLCPLVWRYACWCWTDGVHWQQPAFVDWWQVWTERFREWMAAHLLQPLVRLMGKAHQEVLHIFSADLLGILWSHCCCMCAAAMSG